MTDEPRCYGSGTCNIDSEARGTGALVVAGDALAGLLAPLAGGAAGFSEKDASAVRLVIEARLKAFATDDAERAFSYASTAIRTRFGDAADRACRLWLTKLPGFQR